MHLLSKTPTGMHDISQKVNKYSIKAIFLATLFAWQTVKKKKKTALKIKMFWFWKQALTELTSAANETLLEQFTAFSNISKERVEDNLLWLVLDSWGTNAFFSA